MSKKLILIFISFYQNFLSYIFKTFVGIGNCCRYEVTCSQYAKISVEKYGSLKGSYLAIRRILSCQPFYNPERGFAK